MTTTKTVVVGVVVVVVVEVRCGGVRAGGRETVGSCDDDDLRDEDVAVAADERIS